MILKNYYLENIQKVMKIDLKSIEESAGNLVGILSYNPHCFLA